MTNLKINFIFYRLLILLVFITPLTIEAQKLQARIVAFYNIENLFDTIDTPGINDSDFTPEGPKQWDSQKYWEKIDRLSEVISKLGQHENIQGPAIIGLCELENRSVIEDLVNSERIKHLNYQIVHYESPDNRGMDVALLYQPGCFKVTNTRSVSLKINGDKETKLNTRDQLVVSGLLDNEAVHFIVSHYPSRFGGEARSRYLRIAAAKLSRSIFEEIMEAHPNDKVIIMGDFNDDPINDAIKKHLNAHGKTRRLKKGELYNPMEPLYKQGIGTLAYRGQWNLFDQIIITPNFLGKNNKGYRYHSVRIYNEAFLIMDEGQYKGYPFRSYIGNQYIGGYSDHFPVYIVIVKEY